jgi:hypothetical protein
MGFDLQKVSSRNQISEMTQGVRIEAGFLLG